MLKILLVLAQVMFATIITKTHYIQRLNLILCQFGLVMTPLPRSMCLRLLLMLCYVIQLKYIL